MPTFFKLSHAAVWIFTLTCAIFLNPPCWAGGSACVNGTSVNVCVEWSQGVDPIPGFDFVVSFAAPFDAFNPHIELFEGDAGWKVFAELVASPGTPANIGALSIAPNSATENFVVTIVRPTQQGDQPGAADVGTINLDAASWTGHSSMGSGSHISGDLTGPLTIKSDGNGAGGALSLTIDGHVLPGAAISAPVLQWLQLSGDLRADLEITDYVESGAYLVIAGSIGAQVNIDIASMPGKCQLEFATGTSASDLAGQLLLHSGIDAGQAVKIGNLSGVVDLLGADVVGWFEITGDATGEIVNGGDIRDGGYVTLNTEGEFSGNATFQSVGALSAFRAHGGVFSGSMIVVGDVATGGFIGAHGGDMAASAEISIGGDLGGTFEWPRVLQYDGHVRGTVQIGGSLKGEMLVGGNVIGSIAVTGNCVGDIRGQQDVSGTITIGGQLTSTGRVLVDGTCTGLINVRNATAILSTIRITEGLTSSGEIRVSEIPGVSSASRGTIHIGSTAPSFPLPMVTFDGRIRIDPTGTNEWEGIINVVGCHETNDPLDICICGDDRGTIILMQDDCTPTVTVACVGSCP